MDIFATACEAAGADPGEDTDAESFFAALTGGGEAPERDLYFVRRGDNSEVGQAVYALIHDDWKLVQNSPFQLYNLAEDPREAANLADSHRKKFTQTKWTLAEHVREGGRVPWSPPPLVDEQ